MAGGLNLYGYANGDPVNLSDPFGLCPPCSVSEDGIALIAGFENFRANVYGDEGGRATVGFGHLIQPGESFDKPLTMGQALELLGADIERVVRPGLDMINNKSLEQHQVDAVASLIFNVGPTQFGGSRTRTELNEGRFDDFAREFAGFNKVRNAATGKLEVSNGLTRRRSAELRVFKTGVYPGG